MDNSKLQQFIAVLIDLTLQDIHFDFLEKQTNRQTVITTL